MKHAFISYSHKDSEFVERLERDLNARGIVTWRDETSIPGGTDWYHGIETGLSDAYAVICIVTPNADSSVWVKREQLRAEQDGIPRIAVLPQQHRIPFHLQEVQPIHMDDEHYAVGFAQLTVALARCAREMAEAAQPTADVQEPPEPAPRPRRPTNVEFAMSEPDPVKRAALFRELGEKGLDDRPGIGLKDGLPDIVWGEIPAGEFTFGEGENARRLNIPYTYYLAKYPVTYAQYVGFVTAKGYNESNFWTNTGWEWKEKRQHPELCWNDPQWNVPNQPIVGVTWYEAWAFCNWLDTIVAKPSLGFHIRLPTEAEWEKAARYPDGRRYPWGDTFDLSKCNTQEGGIDRTTPVGIYRAGINPADGAYDLSGNVWEWCLSKYDTNENHHPRGAEARVLRGGSWFDNRDAARSAYRRKDFPQDKYTGVGLRVVVAPPWDIAYASPASSTRDSGAR